LPIRIESINTLNDVVAALKQAGEINLASQVELYVYPVKVEEGRIDFRPAEMASPRLAQDLSQGLKAITGKRWMVSVSSSPGAPTLAEQERAAETAKFDAVKQQKLVAQILEIFPDAELKSIYPKE
jgi:DNA polymerase III subunit gamma/tau